MSIPEFLVPPALRLARADRVFATVPGARRHVAERALRPSRYGPPRTLRRDVAVEVTEHEGWAVYTLRPIETPARGAVVYCHGGGWVNEIVLQHWQLAAQIAAEAGTTVIVPIYPLIPFGTAQEANRVVVDLAVRAREEHGAVCLAGDSAGGQIALSVAVTLRDDHAVTVARTVLIAPALDLSLSHPQIPLVLPHDPWLGVEGTRHLIELWRADLPLEDPRVSPLAADLAGLGPLTIFVGTRDILWPDARLLRDRARAAGVEVELHERPGLVHVYPLLPTRSGRDARGSIVRRIRRALRGAPGDQGSPDGGGSAPRT